MVRDKPGERHGAQTGTQIGGYLMSEEGVTACRSGTDGSLSHWGWDEEANQPGKGNWIPFSF